MEEIPQAASAKSKPALSKILLSLGSAIVLFLLAVISFEAYEASKSFIMILISWGSGVVSATLFLYVLINRVELFPFLAFAHVVVVFFFLLVGILMDGAFTHTFLFGVNMILLIVDAMILAVSFLISALSLKKAINAKDSRAKIKFAIYTFVSMLTAPLALFMLVFGSWVISGD